MTNKTQLTRVHEGSMIAGVAAGLSKYLSVDVSWVRLAFLVLTASGGAGFIIYIICVFVMPVEPKDDSKKTSS